MPSNYSPYRHCKQHVHPPLPCSCLCSHSTGETHRQGESWRLWLEFCSWSTPRSLGTGGRWHWRRKWALSPCRTTDLWCHRTSETHSKSEGSLMTSMASQLSLSKQQNYPYNETILFLKTIQITKKKIIHITKPSRLLTVTKVCVATKTQANSCPRRVLPWQAQSLCGHAAMGRSRSGQWRAASPWWTESHPPPRWSAGVARMWPCRWHSSCPRAVSC